MFLWAVFLVLSCGGYVWWATSGFYVVRAVARIDAATIEAAVFDDGVPEDAAKAVKAGRSASDLRRRVAILSSRPTLSVIEFYGKTGDEAADLAAVMMPRIRGRLGLDSDSRRKLGADQAQNDAWFEQWRSLAFRDLAAFEQLAGTFQGSPSDEDIALSQHQIRHVLNLQQGLRVMAGHAAELKRKLKDTEVIVVSDAPAHYRASPVFLLACLSMVGLSLAGFWRYRYA